MIGKKNPRETAKDYQKAVSFLSRTSPHPFKVVANIGQEKNKKILPKKLQSCHRSVQIRLQQTIPDVVLEKRFPEIGRVADVFWEKERIVFEIQVSPISRWEIKKRVADYKKAGFEVVWILHRKTFGKFRMQKAEKTLLQYPCYYTDIDRSGEGLIYDGWRFFFGKRQYFLSAPFPLHQFRPQKGPPSLTNAPSFFRKRKSRPLYFNGDLLALFLSEPNSSFFFKMKEKEKALKKKLWGHFLSRLLPRIFYQFKQMAFSLINLKINGRRY